ncbi:MAG: Glu-tRNA(Gln) amidotransferase subunit GatE [Candidatus Cloacimonetes bacterium]|nr:Glu-tRNA(Gln) amidotransferase subunit GatE [Candidatus Cloacimonadota bacterium]
MDNFDPRKNYNKTMEQIEYVPRKEATRNTYEKIGFMCGLEVHQQLKTRQKLFCRCPAGIYQDKDDYDAEIYRHMRPTLSELGEYDGTALMEFRTRKNITYRIKNETTCTYEIDDTPPFSLNKEALEYALEIALHLKLNIVGELHITRKQYLDGSIPTGFQRTAIIGIEGEIPLSNKTVRIIQLSIEEDSCREVSDIGHERIYTTDRLGMPLIETVTYPDMKTPDEAKEAGQYIRFLARSTGKVRVGIGAGRQDVNVSVTGGTRVEIKGVANISRIPELTHNEAFRQRALLNIKELLIKKNLDKTSWKISHTILDPLKFNFMNEKENSDLEYKTVVVNLPGFRGILSHFTQPGMCFANEISDRLKVIACLEKPNMISSEDFDSLEKSVFWNEVKKDIKCDENDSQIVFRSSDYDLKTALETIEERCQLAFIGVPNETRKSLSNGTTIFERVLPGPDRMYPDTDSAPISIQDAYIKELGTRIVPGIQNRMKQLSEWKIPTESFSYLLRNNLVPLLEKVEAKLEFSPRITARYLAQNLKHLQGIGIYNEPFDYARIFQLFEFIKEKKLQHEIITEMLPLILHNPNMEFDSILTLIGFTKIDHEEIFSSIPGLMEMFDAVRTTNRQDACIDYIMGVLRKTALGNISMKELGNSVRQICNMKGE